MVIFARKSTWSNIPDLLLRGSQDEVGYVA
jgi:hypothetical protein